MEKIEYNQFAKNKIMKGINVLVTGAAGFIGRALTSRLIELGARVTGFGRGSDSFRPEELIWASGDFTDPVALERCCEGQDYVFHLLNSSTPASATQQPAGDIAANVIPSIQLIQAAATSGVKRFLFFSSGGTVYGRSEANLVHESASCSPLSAYGISKLSIENYVRVLSNLAGMEYRIIRVANPYGAGQSPFKKLGLITTAMHAKFSDRPFELWGDGSIVRDFIHIDDVVSAVIILTLDNGNENIFNVGSGLGRSVSSVLKDIDFLSTKPKLVIKHHQIRRIDVPRNVLDVSRIKKLGWYPSVDWNDGLIDSMNWIKREYM